jgi:integrase
VFVLYRKIAGRPERITIGLYPDLSIEQARDKADELNGAIARGENPGDTRRRVRGESTLGGLYAIFLEQHGKPHKKSWKDDESLFRNYLVSWRLKKISSIRKLDIVSLHAHIGRTSGRYAANRTVQLLRTMFNKAIEWGWDGENPVGKKWKFFREEKRDRFLQPNELPAFFKALDEEPNETIRDYVFMSLVTGARRRNVQAMRWYDISWEQNTWRIPETKSGEPQIVPLSPAALSLLEQRKAVAVGEWVFPARSKSGHLEEPKTAWGSHSETCRPH